MGSFDASLRTIGDRRALPATVTVDDGRIVIYAGDQAIGDWSLAEIHLEPTGGSSYRMAAEGEHILIDIPDSEGFQTAIAARSRMRKRPKVRQDKTRHVKTTAGKVKVEETEVGKAKVGKAKVGKARVERTATRGEPGRTADATRDGSESGEKPTGRLDRILAAAERKWGSLLPPWMFTRMMVGIVTGAMILTLIFPGLVSSFLLICGLLLVLVGAIAYTDPILAAKWLPGRMTPMHVLLFGVTVLLLGVVVGVIS